jgi:hypothetical protein
MGFRQAAKSFQRQKFRGFGRILGLIPPLEYNLGF